MCGLFGMFGNPDKGTVEAGLDRIAHRGPDGRGIYRAGDMLHGHVRLSVLDLSEASNQPFHYYGNVLTYNGELWNYQELRDTLENDVAFSTSGDTEVVAAALMMWGKNALKKMDGMFALAWSNDHSDEHFLARDRYGKIPLYVQKNKGSFIWSSE